LPLLHFERELRSAGGGTVHEAKKCQRFWHRTAMPKIAFEDFRFCATAKALAHAVWFFLLKKEHKK
jgi:hypothetical protein